MRVHSLLAFILAAAGLSACESVKDISAVNQQIPITVYNDQKSVKESGAIYLWPPYSSAAVVDGQGNRCILAASGAKTLDVSSESAFKLGKAFEKIEGLEGNTKARLLELFTKTAAGDAHAAFLDVALFHLCILDQNGTFGKQNKNKAKLVMRAYYKALEAARELK